MSDRLTFMTVSKQLKSCYEKIASLLLIVISIFTDFIANNRLSKFLHLNKDGIAIRGQQAIEPEA